MEIEVTRSARRRKTVQGQLVDGTLRIAIPDRFTRREEQHWISVMQERFLSRDVEIDLERRASNLAERHDLSLPNSIVFSKRQNTRWGSCTPSTKSIRISDRVKRFPSWVVDYVIVHELAHLTQPNHSPEFWKLVDRYPLAERARGFLIAMADSPDAARPEPR